MTGDITQLLKEWSAGDKQALDRLMPMVYNEVRRPAKSHLWGERHQISLQPTALAHEAWRKRWDFRIRRWNAIGALRAWLRKELK